MSGLAAQTDCMRKTGIRMKFNQELRRAAVASEAGEDSLENPVAAGNAPVMAARSFHCFRRTTAGSMVFCASATAEIASVVLSMASCKVSL